MRKTIGILCGGGDAPGLNAVIRAVVKYGAGQKGWRIIGVENGFHGLLQTPHRVRELTPVSCRGLLQEGGTILGTTNRGDPFRMADGLDHSEDLVGAMNAWGMEGLVLLGGDGSMRIASGLQAARGVRIVGVPKTIDNDLGATELTFGFQSAVDCATNALDRLHSTAEAHARVQILEVMGRDAGWIALHAGMSGGADCVVLPEIPWTAERLVHKIVERQGLGRPFSLIIVAEGAKPAGEQPGLVISGEKKRAGSAGQRVLEAIELLLPEVEVRLTVLGHLQRGGSPVASDRLLATRFGVAAVDLVEAGRWGEMVCLVNGEVSGAPIATAAATYRRVSPDDPIVRAARAVGIEFGG